MFKESNTKKARRKLEIKKLAEKATDEINKNKLLSQTLNIYQQQINIIKNILEIKSKLNNKDNKEIINSKYIINESNINKSIKKEFLSYYNQLKISVESLKEGNKKLLQKYEINYNKIFDETSLTKIDLYKNRTDIFILDFELKKKNDIIKKLNENLINSRRHSIFREIKRESETNRIVGTNYINTDNLYLQRDLQVECRKYNKCLNSIKKKEKKIENIKETENYLEEAIEFCKKETKMNNKNNNKIFDNKIDNIKTSNFFSLSSKQKKINDKRQSNNRNINNYNSITIDELGKKYQFEDSINIINDDYKYNKDVTFMHNNSNFNSLLFSSDNIQLSNKSNSTKDKDKEKKKKVKQKLNFLTVDELFDLENVEGEKEFIIQEELHSDDEIIFERKIKNKNRISTEYLNQIKKQVPQLYLNQIEFNKKKVMNEADLYSFQRREFNRQNIDENIKTIKKKKKIMKKRIDINKEKLDALENFDKKAKEQYKVLKPIKVLSSMKDYDISFMKKEFYNFRMNKKVNNGIIPEVEETNNKAEGDKDSPESDDKYNLGYEEDFDDYSDKMRKKINKYNNNNAVTEADIEYDNNPNGKKSVEYDNDDNKAKSK